MIDHVSIGTHRLDEAIRFYSACFATLGYLLEHQTTSEAAFGPRGQSVFWLNPVSNEKAIIGESSHIALTAGTQEQVEQFHKVAMQHGGVTVRMPGKRPDISPNYFGTVVLDLDGHTIEVVHWSDD